MALRIDDAYDADWRKALPHLAGRLVTVREVQIADAPTLFDQLTDPRVTTYISAPPPSVGAFEGFIAWAHQQRQTGRSVCFGIVPHGLQRAIGIIQVRSSELSFDVAEWGFAVGSSFWSTGVFLEAAGLVARFAFDQLGCYRLEGRAVSANGRANGALAKIGGAADAILSRSFKRCDGYDEQLLWSLLADEWRASSSNERQRFLESTAKEKIRRAVAEVTKRVLAERPHKSVDQPLHAFFVTARSIQPKCTKCGEPVSADGVCGRCRQ